MAEKRSALTNREISLFCAQIHMMLSSGLALYEGIEALARSYQGTDNEKIYDLLSEEVSRTGLLSEAFKSDAGWPKYLSQMTKVGETTGALEEIMKNLASHYEREARIQEAVKSAVIYPMVLGCMVLVIVCVMLMMVLPMFRSVLSSMGVAFTNAGSGLISVGVALGWCVLAVVGLGILGAVTAVVLMKTPLRAKVVRILLAAFAPIRRVARRLDASRIAMVLSMSFSGGFPMDEGVRMASSIASDENTESLLKRMSASMEGGASFADAMAQTGLYDPIYIGMLKTGADIGKTDGVLSKIAEEYDRQAEKGISSIVSVIEPTLVAVLAVVVGAMLLSVMLPMAGVLVGIF